MSGSVLSLVLSLSLMDGQIIIMDRSLYVDMGWLQVVGSLDLQVSFAKEPYERDYILQKRPSVLRSLLIVATP